MGFITALPLTVATVVMAAATLSSSSSAFNAFVAPSSQIQLRQHTSCARSVVGKSRHDRDVSPCMKYVPDGLSPEQWKKMQKEEAVKKKKMGDLGQVGVKSFKSRSLQAWQEDGAGHLFPVDPKKVKSGEIPPEKTPYMQRKGAWDDSDLAQKNVKSKQTGKAIAKKKWSSVDKAYAAKPTTAAERAAAEKKAAADKKKREAKQGAKNVKPEDVGAKKKGLFGLW
ncbi:unnamed protein product [Pylaiella littoralis]